MGEISRISDTILPVKRCTPPDKGWQRRHCASKGLNFASISTLESRMDSEEIFDVRGCALRIVGRRFDPSIRLRFSRFYQSNAAT